MSLTNRQKFMLAVISTAYEGATFTPVQVQKLFFLLDREASAFTEGPHFSFAAYDYGPFDRFVYDELDYLQRIGLVLIIAGRYRMYTLSKEGYQIGRQELPKFDPTIQNYFLACCEWVRSLNFEQLVAAIYNKYPEMREKSVFKG